MSSLINEIQFPELAEPLQASGWSSSRCVERRIDLSSLNEKGFAICPMSRRVLREFGGLAFEVDVLVERTKTRRKQSWIDRFFNREEKLPEIRVAMKLSFSLGDILASILPEDVLYCASYTVGSILCPIAVYSGPDTVVYTDVAGKFFMYDSQMEKVYRFTGFCELLSAFFANDISDVIEERWQSIDAPDGFEWDCGPFKEAGLEM